MPLSSKLLHPGSALVAATLSLSVLVAGCSSGGDAAPTSPDAVGAASDEVTVPVTAATTEILDAGAEPRAVVQLRPGQGTQQQTRLVTTADVSQQIDGQAAQDFSTPQLTIPLTALVTQAATDATPATTVDLTLGTPTTPEDETNELLTPATDSHAGFTMNESGAITALRLRPDPDAQNKARSMIEQAFFQAVYRMVAFPAEPIGVGAVWKIHQQVMSAIALDQVTTATLSARDGDRLTIDMQVEQFPKSPVFELPNGAGTLDVDSYSLRGAGTVVIDLRSPLPIDGSVTVEGTQSFSDPADSMRLQQTTSEKVEWLG
ncbi:hypothetical protein EGT67_12650 [Prescottella agglutinans]|uniref:Lipoprotein n=1 Tax=Prescottella agglutinans TaxID=1644129 RepID=A0A438BDF1_9NOCA|nr:hypothetical protein [Prescottella agglutinans]RVW09009.1 hypothetical protein EGT67_12650 [Prescottella agglutinans]